LASCTSVEVVGKALGEELSIDSLFSANDNVGIPNLLTWRVNDWQFDTWYTVNINNVQSLSGGTRAYSYDVFINYKNLIDIAFPLEAGDQVVGNSITGSLDSDIDQDSFEVELEGNVTISGSSQFSNLVFFLSVYDANKLLIVSADETIDIDLVGGIYTVVLSLCHPTSGSCYSGTRDYIVTAN